MHISRFTQLLIFSCVVLFVPTYLYLRPSAYHLSAESEGLKAPGGLIGGGGEMKMGSQGWGPVALDDEIPAGGAGAGAGAGSAWSKWVDPARMKSGDFWKSAWKTPWAAAGAGGSAAKSNGEGGASPHGEVVVAPAAGAAGSAAGAGAGAGVIPAANGGEAFASKMANATAK